MERSDTSLSVSRHPLGAQRLGRSAFCINHHRRFIKQRNLNLKVAYLPHYFFADNLGYSGWSEITAKEFDPETIPLDAAERYYHDRLWRPYLERGLSKYPQVVTNSELPSEYVFAPLQIPWDTVMSLSRVKQDDMVRALVDQASDIPVVIKVHPFSRQKVPEHVDWIESLHDPRKGVFVVEDHVHRLIRNSSAVVCVNSGVGLEALLLGKPVITCGETDYHHLTFKAHAPGDLRGLIENARAPDQVTLCRYAKWLFGEQYIDVREDPAIWVDEVYSRLMRTGRRGRRS